MNILYIKILPTLLAESHSAWRLWVWLVPGGVWRQQSAGSCAEWGTWTSIWRCWFYPQHPPAPVNSCARSSPRSRPRTGAPDRRDKCWTLCRGGTKREEDASDDSAGVFFPSLVVSPSCSCPTLLSCEWKTPEPLLLLPLLLVRAALPSMRTRPPPVRPRGVALVVILTARQWRAQEV